MKQSYYYRLGSTTWTYTKGSYESVDVEGLMNEDELLHMGAVKVSEEDTPEIELPEFIGGLEPDTPFIRPSGELKEWMKNIQKQLNEHKDTQEIEELPVWNPDVNKDDVMQLKQRVLLHDRKLNEVIRHLNREG